jgi:hypothetical protein
MNNDPFAQLVGQGDNVQHFSEPAPVSPARQLVDYPSERAGHTYTPEDFRSVAAAGTPARLAGLRVVTIDLSVLNTNKLIDVGGNIIFFQFSVNVTDKLTIKADTVDSPAIPLMPGGKIQGFAFDRLYVTNAAIVGAVGSVLLVANVADAPPDFE